MPQHHTDERKGMDEPHIFFPPLFINLPLTMHVACDTSFPVQGVKTVAELMVQMVICLCPSSGPSINGTLWDMFEDNILVSSYTPCFSLGLYQVALRSSFTRVSTLLTLFFIHVGRQVLIHLFLHLKLCTYLSESIVYVIVNILNK